MCVCMNVCVCMCVCVCLCACACACACVCVSIKDISPQDNECSEASEQSEEHKGCRDMCCVHVSLITYCGLRIRVPDNSKPTGRRLS